MHSLNRQRKDKVRQLISFTGIGEAKAIELLSLTGWQIEAAADHFFMSGGASQPAIDPAKAGELFDSYKGA